MSARDHRWWIAWSLSVSMMRTSMAEILLRPNVRALYAGLFVPGAIGIIGLAMALGPWDAASWVRVVGWILVALGGLVAVMLVWQGRQPRLAYEDGLLLLNLRSGAPIRLPIELVQCAFLGAGSTQLPGLGGREIRTANLVMRLEEKASDWAEVSVKSALGRWSEGYITIHGAWCEPLTLDLVQHLNQRLHELKQVRGQGSGVGGQEC
jgi:hypothetical protein